MHKLVPPTGIGSLIKRIKTEELSRTCSVCGAPMVHFTDGYSTLNKCMQCGYSQKPVGDISDQHKFDGVLTVTVINAAHNKKAFFETYQPLDEQLYNSLISAGRSPQEAHKEVILDLGLDDAAKEYFDSKVNYLGVD